MGFGVIIASGEKNKILSDKLLDSLAEVRVEQFLDEPARFAIRFQEDIAGSQPFLMDSHELQCNQMITIAVQVDKKMKCLVRGPITDMESSFQLGGPGSWHQVCGQDRRVQMDREIRCEAWTGEATQVANKILDDNSFEMGKVAHAGPAYGGKREGQRQTTSTLNQRESDLAFVLKIARSNDLHFWLEYKCRRNPLDPLGPSLHVEETAYLTHSPPRPQGATAEPVPVAQIKLSKTVDLALRVNTANQCGPNVTAFNVTVDPERPSRFQRKAIDDQDVTPHQMAPTDPQSPLVRGGRRLADCQPSHDLCITTAGSPDEVQRKAKAALAEAGWFVHATASTTAHMLGGVLAPHDIVEVEGLGNVHSGPYQVEAVTHVITAADHFMDIQLRRNALGRG